MRMILSLLVHILQRQSLKIAPKIGAFRIDAGFGQEMSQRLRENLKLSPGGQTINRRCSLPFRQGSRIFPKSLARKPQSTKMLRVESESDFT